MTKIENQLSTPGLRHHSSDNMDMVIVICFLALGFCNLNFTPTENAV